MKSFVLFFFLIPTFLFAQASMDYAHYHQQVIKAEEALANERYEASLQIYEQLFADYDFIFLREYQLAAQLAWQLQDTAKTHEYIRQALLGGWTLKGVKKNAFLDGWRSGSGWKSIRKEYPTLRKQYEAQLNLPLRKQVKKLFAKDQWKAFGAFIKLSDKGQERYSENKFAPHSEQQLAQLIDLINTHGYPGEQLIGNDFWGSTILSHHNSISTAYAIQDTLYPFLKPQLRAAVEKGQMSPFEYTFIDEWYRSSRSDHSDPPYGWLRIPSPEQLATSNQLRQDIYLRSIPLRNQLADLQQRTGMQLYLPGSPWVNGRIE